MRSTVAVVTVLLTILIASSAASIENQKDFNGNFVNQLDANDSRLEILTEAVVKHNSCQDRLWACQKPCRAQVPLKSNDTVPQCTSPHPGESCFGVPIDYNYVPSRDSLPVEYEVLKRFPRCWSALGPMLCGLIYRPCGVYSFSARLPSQTGRLEVWQRYPAAQCTRVIEQCEDAIKEGFFPSHLIDCKRTAENATWVKEKTNATGSLARYVPSGNVEDLKTEWDRQTVFTEEGCAIKYAENASRHEQMQCIFPLVYTMHEKIAPVIDKCFLPCRNPLISSPEKFLSFQIGRAFLCFALAFVCLAIFCHLCGFSKIFVDSDCIYAIACAFFTFAAYLILWGLGSIPAFAKAAECTRTAHGVDIRSTRELESAWCSITALGQHVFLLSTIGFLSASYALSAAAATRAAEAENRKKSEKLSGFRFYLTAAVVIVSSAIGFLALSLQMFSTDGVSGVCSVGLHSLVGHLTVVILPGLAYCIIGLAAGARATWRERKQRESEIADAVVERVREGIEYEKAKKKIEFWEARGPSQKEDMQEQIRAGVLHKIEERTECSESTESREKEEVGGGGDEKTGEDEKILVLAGDEDEERLSEAQKREIAQTVRQEMNEEWRGREKRAWHAAISSRYTLAAVCICMASLIFGLCVHYASLANSGRDEVDAVKAYITCVMSKSIVRKDLHWLSEPAHAAELWHDGKGENNPLERRHNLASELLIHDCAYPSSGDGRIFGLLTVFILLPLAPLTVLIWAFGAGLVGFGGMPSVKLCRPKPARKEKDVEMRALTTERDDDSEMMSTVGSVASSVSCDGGDGRQRRRRVTSTVSTRLSSSAATSEDDDDSEGGGASSSHTSVSLRGDRARFASRERLITVRAPSEVPSTARSEQVVAPEARTRTERHHRRLDILGRAQERRGRSKKKSKKRTPSVEEQNARRDGVAESGQLVPARAVSHPQSRAAAAPDDVRSMSSYTSRDGEGPSSTVSSNLAPPSEAGRIIRANYEALMARANLMSSRPGQLQDQLQIVAEEHHLHHALHLQSPPKDDENDNSAMRSDDMYWIRNLSGVRDKMLQYSGDPVFQGAESVGCQLVGLALQFARNSMSHGTVYERANYMYLQYAFDRLQTLAFHLQRRITVPLSLVMELTAAVTMFGSMMNVPRPQVDFQRQLAMDAISAEAQQYRQRANEEGISDEQREEVYREMLMGTNLRIVRRLMGLPANEEAIAQLGQEQQRLQAAAVAQGRPPVYAPSRTIDLTQPPEGASSASSEASFSVTNSDAPSSLLSSTDDHPLIRRYVEAHQPPPGYPAAGSPAAAAAAARAPPPPPASTGSATSDFIEQLRRAGGMQGLVPPGPAYARQSAAFPAPTSSDNGLSSLNGDDDDDSDVDVMSSETSMDSMGRPSGYFSAGSYGIPTRSAALNGRNLSSQPAQQQPGFRPGPQPVFNLFGNVNMPAPTVSVPSFPGARPMQELQEAAFQRDVDQQHRPAWNNAALPRMMQGMGVQDRNGESSSSSFSDLPEPPSGFPPASKDKKKRKASPLEAESSCSSSDRRRDDSDPPPRVGLVRVLGVEDARPPAVLVDMEAGEMSSRRVAEEQAESDGDSGVGSVDDTAHHRYGRPATKAEFKKWNETVKNEMAEYLQKKMEDEEEKEKKKDEEEKKKEKDDDENDNGDDDGADDDDDGDEGGIVDVVGLRSPDARCAVVDVEDEEAARRRARMDLLNNRYLNHSDPDLAMADEERERRERAQRAREREAEVEREDEERRQIQEARQRLQEQRMDRAVNVAADDEEDVTSDDISLSSVMSQGEQRQLVRTVRAALDGRSLEGMSDDDVRLVQHLRLALESDGNISRDVIMRYRVDETNRLNRERHNPDNNNPYRLSSVVMSRMSLAEIGARVDAIRSLSNATLYPLEIFYQLHLADVLWPLAGRHIVMGDNVYTHDEINRVLGNDSPMVPPGADRMDFHQLMRKRAITAASITGRSYGASRGTAGFQYQPPRLPDLGMYQLFGDPLVLVAAMEGDLAPIREAIQRMPLTMPDVMRLDNRSENTLGSHLRHFRDYLDEQARQAGFDLRPDTYLHDAVPPEPTGSRPTGRQEEDGAEPPAPDPTAKRGPRRGPNPDPDTDPEF